MKKVIILSIAAFLFCSIPSAYALDSIIIADSKECECTTFSDIAAKYNSLKKNIECERNTSETPEAYENRIKKGKKNLDAFLNTVYEGKFDLDCVSMDWSSNQLITAKEFPVEFMRGDCPCKELILATATSHIRLREFITFKKFLNYIITFKINEDCVMQVLNLKVVYRDKEVINEINLSPSL